MRIFGKELVGCFIDVAKYGELRSAIPDKKLEIIEIIDEAEIEEIRARYIPYLEGISAYPAAVTLGDEMIFIGDGNKNEGFVYYVDIEFGVFKLHESIEDFLNETRP